MGWRVEITGYEELMKALDRIDDQLGVKLRRQCVKAAAEIVARRAKELCPASAQTGTRRQWSKGLAAERAGVKPLRETIGIAIRDYDQRTLAVVGPEYPAGALGHLVEFGHQEVLYGRRTGRRVPPHAFLRRAFDETREAQEAAMDAVVKQAIREIGT